MSLTLNRSTLLLQIFLAAIITISCTKKRKAIAHDDPITIIEETPDQAFNDSLYGFVQHTKMEGIGILTTTDNYFGDTISIIDINKNRLPDIIINVEDDFLQLQCLSQDSLYYNVKLNDNQIGLISKKQDKVVLKTWDEYILNAFCVEFNPVTNPLLQQPDENSKKVIFNEDEFYLPVAIKDNWLKVKWGDDDNLSYGWIKWKDGNNLLIKIFHSA
ncbi:MAG: hypothetical protein BM557_06580 [Flavobacterium sp. MedPE-SWcel]|uniref:hypothetical protein n=1 Tax=uncultured Flavobacterium sp. TaxID=165435 RepID=UPI00090F2701|nr:hypothetical protein [uncultured Flavobacterium sp.]OIQ19365.1 MAG: hypothetical protein BM557_06580 [Flavobacterium sp. MedPE-SWcel]